MHPSCFETIKIKDGKIFNLDWHNRRFNATQKMLFLNSSTMDLQTVITPPKSGLYRCKITYGNNTIHSIEYFPYKAKEITHFTIVKSHLDYQYKYTDRSSFQKLLLGNNEIIIEKDGLLTDTSIANIAFFDGKSWLTPKTPLLAGTTRARLLEENFLKLENIKKENLQNYSNFALMNAMIGFRIQKSVNIQQ